MARLGRSFPSRPLTGELQSRGVAATIVEATVATLVLDGALTHVVLNGVSEVASVATIVLDGALSHTVVAGGRVEATVGSLVFTGNTTTVTSTVSVTATVGSLTVTGNATEVIAGGYIPADAGTLVLTGQAAAVVNSGNIYVTVGALVLTGNPAVVHATSTVTATVGSFVLVGNTAVPHVGEQQTATVGSLSFEGQVATVTNGITIAVDVGTLVVVGNATQVNVGMIVEVSAGTLAFTGNSFTRAGQELVYPLVGTLVLQGNPYSIDLPLPLPTEAWRNPRRPAFTGALAPVGEAFDSLEKYLRRPAMPNGFVLGNSDIGTPTEVKWVTFGNLAESAFVDTVAPDVLGNVTVTGYAQALLVHWDEITDPSITQYEVQVATDASFVDIVETRTSGGNNCLVSGLSYDTVYYVRARAVDVGNNIGPWSLTASAECNRFQGSVDLVAGSVTADILGANSVTAGKLDAVYMGVGKYVRSTMYTAGSIGWSIDANGQAEFNNVTVRGTLASTNVAANSELVVNGAARSNTYSQGAAGWKISGDGTAEFNNVKIRGELDTSTIKSGSNLTVYGRIQAPGGTTWFIDGSGNAEFNSLKVRITAPSTVGTGGSVSSNTTSAPTSTGTAAATAGTGWKISADGTAYFANAIIKGDVIGARLFGGEIFAGTVTVAKGDIKSESYASGTSGWIIKGDGSAEMNNLWVRNTVFVSGELRAGVSIAAPNITGGNINGINIVAANITGTSTITGAEITGGTIKTASSGQYIAMETGDQDTIKFYTPAGTWGSINAEHNRLSILSPADGSQSYIDLYGSSRWGTGETAIVLGASYVQVATTLYAGGSVYADANVQGQYVYHKNGGYLAQEGNSSVKLLCDGAFVRFRWDGEGFYALLNDSQFVRLN